MHGFVVPGSVSLREVVGQLRTVSGLPLIVHQRAEQAALDEGVLFELQLEHPISVENVLDLVTDQAGDEVVWIIRHDAVIVTTRRHALAGRQGLRMYDLRTLTHGRTDFSAPRIDRIRPLDELEDDDGGGPFGGVGERVCAFDEDAIVSLVQEHVVPGTWEEEGVSIEAMNGILFVVHAPEVQARVARFLGNLVGV